MRKNITKEVKKTYIEVVEIIVANGDITSVPLEDLTVMGSVTMERANLRAKRAYNGKTVAVVGLKEEITVYTMPLDFFIANATIKEVPELDDEDDEDMDDEDLELEA